MRRDYFSERSAEYAAFRPRYPAVLFTRLADLAPSRTLAWDCATGNGQAALGLADLFERVVATDASAQQIANAVAHPRVTYRVASAHESGLTDRSASLVTVAQAAHWLDLPAFYAEARRVLQRRGVIALWTYGPMRADAGIQQVMEEFRTRTVARWWPPGREHVDSGYAMLDFPFEEARLETLDMEADFTLADLLGYAGTWSAVLFCRKETGNDPLPELEARLAPLWGAPGACRRVRWPLAVRIGRTSSD